MPHFLVLLGKVVPSLSPWRVRGCITSCQVPWMPIILVPVYTHPRQPVCRYSRSCSGGTAGFLLLALCMPLSKPLHTTCHSFPPMCCLPAPGTDTARHLPLDSLQNICSIESVSALHTRPQSSACPLPDTPHILVLNYLLYTIDEIPRGEELCPVHCYMPRT